MTLDKQTSTEPGVERKAGGPSAPAQRRIAVILGLDRFSGLYVWAVLILIFSLWVPNLFLTATNARIIAGSQAITAMVALGLIVPVACGAFDLSIAGTLGMGVCIVIWSQAHGHGYALGIVVALAFGHRKLLRDPHACIAFWHSRQIFISRQHPIALAGQFCISSSSTGHQHRSHSQSRLM